MRHTQELNYLYHKHPLLIQIEERDIALAQATRKLAAADALIATLRKRVESNTARNSRDQHMTTTQPSTTAATPAGD